MLSTKSSTSKYSISFPSYSFKNIEDRIANMNSHWHVKYTSDDPLIEVLYQSNRLYKDLMDQQKRAAEDNIRRKHASKQQAAQVLKRNSSRRRR